MIVLAILPLIFWVVGVIVGLIGWATNIMALVTISFGLFGGAVICVVAMLAYIIWVELLS